MEDLEYRHVDVFSRTAFQGNGLVVVLDAGRLSADLQQRLTREVRQFETAFVTELDLDGRTARLRIFTVEEELAFAGHPVLGAAAVLHTLTADQGALETWSVALGDRLVRVLTRGRDGWLDVSMDQGPAQLGPAVTGELADRCREALGLSPDAIHPDLPLQVVSTGLPYLIVPVTSTGLAAAAIGVDDFELLLGRCAAKFVYVLCPDELEGRTWDNAGRVEDIATGSAAGPVAGYLLANRRHPVDRPVRLTQGRFVGRPSAMEIRRESRNGHLWVGGPVARVAAGRFEIGSSATMDEVKAS